jgi:hypothetical protein
MPVVRDGENVILHCNFEELTALRAAAARVLEGAGPGELSIAAPTESIHAVHALEPWLEGDMELESLVEQRSVQRAMQTLLADVRVRMDREVLAGHAAAEDAVATYFEYAHILTVLDRVQRIGAEMEALIELMTGAPPDEASAATFNFSE